MGSFVSIQINNCRKNQGEELVINKAGLTKVPVEISTLTHLKKINLTQNQLCTLSFDLLLLPHLTELDLSVNELTEIPSEVTASLSLRSLDVSFNEVCNQWSSS